MARVVVNATGAFCDGIRHLADPNAPRLVSPSQGTHLVFARSLLPGDNALLVPKTPDGRVLFAIPWHGHTLVGTTDVPIAEASSEPRPTDQEIDFILDTAGRYLATKPTRADVLSAFAGIRPLVKATGVTRTATLSREHTIHTDRPGLVTITGGKWTTYRAMAEDCVNVAAELASLPRRLCVTPHRRIRGPDAATEAERLHPDLPYTIADVIRAVAHGNGSHRRGRAGPTHAGTIPECSCRPSDGAASGGDHRGGDKPRRPVAGRADPNVRGVGGTNIASRFLDFEGLEA